MKRCIFLFVPATPHTDHPATAQPEAARSTAIAAVCFALALALFAAAAPVWSATTLRCGYNLVKTGDPKFIVEEYCGAPLSKDFVGQTTYYEGSRKHKVYIEEWIYELRYGFYDILTFRGNRLIKMELKQK